MNGIAKKSCRCRRCREGRLNAVADVRIVAGRVEARCTGRERVSLAFAIAAMLRDPNRGFGFVSRTGTLLESLAVREDGDAWVVSLDAPSAGFVEKRTRTVEVAAELARFIYPADRDWHLKTAKALKLIAEFRAAA